jgi:predicted GIY-YIG superfamily endonuclease
MEEEKKPLLFSTPTKDWYVYCLGTVNRPIQTYIGATVDVDRRLKQHNSGPQKGGARRTGMRPEEWYRICYVKGFSDNHSALSFEWHWKHFSRKIATKMEPLERRQKALDMCLEWAKEKGDTLTVIYE